MALLGLAWASVIPLDPFEQQPRSSDDPPFLREDTYAMPYPEPGVTTADRLHDLLDTWRPGLLLLLIPVVVGMFTLAYTHSSPKSEPDPLLVVEDSSAVEAMVTGLLTEPGDSGGEVAARRTGTSSSSTTSTSTTAGAVVAPPPGGPTTGGGRTEPDPTATTASTTTAPASTSVEPTSPTTTTTAPTTTATDPAECWIQVRNRTTMRAEPSPDAEKVRRVGGYYQVQQISESDDSTWYQITARGSSGWVSDDRVSFTDGCDG